LDHALREDASTRSDDAPIGVSRVLRDAELQPDLDRRLEEFNRNRPHQGRWCFGKTPMQTFLDAKPIAEEKMIAA